MGTEALIGLENVFVELPKPVCLVSVAGLLPRPLTLTSALVGMHFW